MLSSTSARYVVDDDYAIGRPVAEARVVPDPLGAQWGTPALVELVAPEVASDRDPVDLLARNWRSAMTPRTATAMWRTILDVDVRAMLPLVQAPTLILHNTGGIVPFSHAEYLAEHIAGARLVERPGRGSSGFAGADGSFTTEKIAEFLLGTSARCLSIGF